MNIRISKWTIYTAEVTLASIIAVSACAATARAESFSVTAGQGTETWKAEPGQSMPAGTQGTLDGLLSVNLAGEYIFTYGAEALYPGIRGMATRLFQMNSG